MILFIRNWLVQRMLNRFKIPRDMIRFAFRRHKENKAIITAQKAVTFQELENRTLSLATGLAGLGIQKGDSIFVMVTNGINQIEISMTGFETGIMLTSFNARYTKENILRAAELIKPKLFIYDAPIAEDAATLLKDNIPDLQFLEIGENYENFIVKHPAQNSKNKIDPNDIVALGFTSGTTGEPKALPATHGVFVKSLQLVVKNVGIGPKKKKPDVFLVAIPLAGAGSGVVLPAILSGAAILVPSAYNAGLFLELIQQYKVTRMFITPSLLIDLLDHPKLDDYDLSSLGNVIYGTETLAAAKLEEAIKRFGPIFQQGYGSAEVLPPVSMLQPKDHMEKGKIANRNVLTSVGKVVPQVKVKIENDGGHTLPYKEIGHVMIQSPTLFKGYWKRPDLTARAIVDGWLKIGDLGYLEADGRLHILGRLADLIIKEGHTIYPRQVEEHVHDYRAVKECNLVQVEEKAILAVSLRHTYRNLDNHHKIKQEISDLLKERLEVYQLPDKIEIFEELPRSFLAKVLRREVREFLKTTSNMTA